MAAIAAHMALTPRRQAGVGIKPLPADASHLRTAPLSARQRKQVYMQSMIFTDHSKVQPEMVRSAMYNHALGSHSVYAVARQQMVYDSIKTLVPQAHASTTTVEPAPLCARSGYGQPKTRPGPKSGIEGSFPISHEGPASPPPPEDDKASATPSKKQVPAPSAQGCGAKTKSATSSMRRSMSAPAPREGFLSARQRKQVYNHSTIFEEGGPSPRSLYDLATQRFLHEELNSVRKSIGPAHTELRNLPCPADMRVTMNQGHGLVIPKEETDEDGGQGSRELLQFCDDPERMPIVHARGREQDTIPREFWNTTPHLAWNDHRAEIAAGQRGGQREARRDIALKRKALRDWEMSSEVLGFVRRPEASEGALDHQEPLGFPSGPTTPRGDHLQRRAQPAASVSGPLSPRLRKTRDTFMTSSESQFHRPSTPLASPRVSTRTEAATGTSDAEGRRRTDKNFSDLFDTATSALERRNVDRSSFLDTLVPDTFSTSSEVARRRMRPRSVDTARSLLTGAAPLENDPVSPRSPPAQRRYGFNDGELACRETRSGMDASVEVARRMRERLSARTGAQKQAEVQSHSERKRLGLCSGSVRAALSGPDATWDDGRASEPPISQGVPMKVRSCSSSPSAFGRRSLLSTARTKYIAEVLLSDHF